MTHRWIQPTKDGAWLWMPMTRTRSGTREGRGTSLSISALRRLRDQIDECLAAHESGLVERAVSRVACDERTAALGETRNTTGDPQ